MRRYRVNASVPNLFDSKDYDVWARNCWEAEEYVRQKIDREYRGSRADLKAARVMAFDCKVGERVDAVASVRFELVGSSEFDVSLPEYYADWVDCARLQLLDQIGEGDLPTFDKWTLNASAEFFNPDSGDGDKRKLTEYYETLERRASFWKTIKRVAERRLEELEGKLEK
ncbi:MAG: hypothetical protein IJE77_05335 [Thermoguttaceae bacterium]|nr:hypothetical protein [Thermoguttaceae bacterium]